MFKFQKRASIIDRAYYHGEISIEEVHSLLVNVGDFLVYYDPNFVVGRKITGAYFLVVKYEGDAEDNSPYFTLRFANFRSLDFIPRIIDKYYPSRKILNNDPKVVLINPVLKKPKAPSIVQTSENFKSDVLNTIKGVFKLIIDEDEEINTSLSSSSGHKFTTCEEKSVVEGSSKHWSFHLQPSHHAFSLSQNNSEKTNTLPKAEVENIVSSSVSQSSGPPTNTINEEGRENSVKITKIVHDRDDHSNGNMTSSNAPKNASKEALPPLLPPKNSRISDKNTSSNSANSNKSEEGVADERVVLEYALAKAKSFPDFVRICHSELQTSVNSNASAKIIQAAEMLFEYSKKMVNDHFESPNHVV